MNLGYVLYVVVSYDELFSMFGSLSFGLPFCSRTNGDHPWLKEVSDNHSVLTLLLLSPTGKCNPFVLFFLSTEPEPRSLVCQFREFFFFLYLASMFQGKWILRAWFRFCWLPKWTLHRPSSVFACVGDHGVFSWFVCAWGVNLKELLLGSIFAFLFEHILMAHLIIRNSLN